MPATATLTAFYEFSTGTSIRSAEMNTNFQFIRGHIIPLETTTLLAADLSFDLGGVDHRWNRVWNAYTNYSEVASAPSAPAADFLTVYAKTDNGLYKMGSDGIETPISGGGVVTFASTATVANNTAVLTTLSSSLILSSSYTSWELKYKIYRNTSVEERLEIGVLTAGYKPVAGTWDYSRRTDHGDDALNRTIGLAVETATGSLLYSSDSMAGTGYTGTITFELIRKF